MARLFDGPPLLDKENGDIFVFSFLQPTKARKISYREQQELLRIGMHFKLGLFGTLKLALALQFIVTNTYFSVARTLTLVLHATLKFVTMNCNANANFSIPNKPSYIL